jgi:lysophospholipase L1-like esterase
VTGASGNGNGGSGNTGGDSAGSGGSTGNGGAGTSGTAASAGSGGAAGAGAGGSGSIESLHYSGRWNIQGGGQATTVNSGSYVIAQFTGTAVTGKFDISVNDKTDMPTVAWRVDNASSWNVAEVAATLSMGSNLPAGVHQITVIARGLDENKNRWSPPLASSVTFLGFDVTGGAVQATPRAAQPKLEVFGDSITEGVIVQGGSYMGHSGQCWQNDAVYSYPTQTGMMLNADYRQVGFGYQGLLKTGDGGVPAANDSFPWVYKGVPRDDWQPDMVVINQGTNDSAKPAATFKAAYTTFVTTIRTSYPNAKIVALRPFSGAQAAQIQSAVTAANAAGDQRVYYVDTTGWLGNGDFNDGLHPNVQGSGKAATALVAAIKKIGFP